MSDLIYRQDAIDALCNSFCGGHHDCEFYPECGNLEDIQAVPSAEKVQLSGEDATFDCISRQATIDVEGLDEQIRCEICRNPMHTNRGCDGNCKYDEKLYERIMQILGERIKPSPSAEPRKKGKWIKKEPTIKELHGCYYECSKCHKFSLPFQKLNFCPNCGADMREGEEDE